MKSTGIWDLKTALSHGGHKHDKGLLDEILKLYSPTRIADLGCGDGWYCKQIKNSYKNIIVYGFEGSFDMVKHGVYEEIFNMDLSEPQTIGDKYDLVLCLEVGEHIPKEFEQNFLDNVKNFSSKDLILSWALPKQGGRGHVNELPLDYVKTEMIKRGFIVNEEKTQSLRSAATLKWLKNTVVAYELG